MSYFLSNYQVNLQILKNKFRLDRLKGVFFIFLILGAMLSCGSEEPIAIEKTIVQAFAEDPESLGRG